MQCEPAGVVLIHGGGATGAFWDRVVPLLDAPTLAVDLPGRRDRPADLTSLTVEAEVAAVVDDIAAARWNGPILLVAHSSGGLVVPGVVAVLGDRIAHVVLNAALVPEEGGCGLDCMQPHHRDGLRAAVELARAGQGPMPTTAGPPADAERFRTTYGGDPLTDDELAFVVDPERCVVDTVHHYFQPVHWSHAAGVGITYLVNDRDRPVPPEMQLEMTGRLPGDVRVVHLDSGHVPAITRPAELAGVIESSW